MTRWQPRSWEPAEHLPGLTNPEHVDLCQEHTMRTGGYDEKASVLVDDTALWCKLDRGIYRQCRDGVAVPFHVAAVLYGLETAIRAVRSCLWMSATELDPQYSSGACRECLEVAHS